MRISAKGEYAIKAMLDLALADGGGLRPIQDIATRQDILGGVFHLWQRNQLINGRNLIRLLREIEKVRGASNGIYIFSIIDRRITNNQSGSCFDSRGSPDYLVPEVCNHLLFMKDSRRS